MTHRKNNAEEFDGQPIDEQGQDAPYTCEAPPPEQNTDNVSDESFENGDNPSAMAEQATDWKDKYLRLSAEFDNYRKRTLREKMEIIAAGGEDVIKSLLAVMDDFDRAVAAMRTTDDVESVRQGIELIRQKFSDTLKAKGLSEIHAKSEPLDTDLHDAVAQFPVEDPAMKGKVVDVVQKGYKLKDKVIRHCKVVVGE